LAGKLGTLRIIDLSYDGFTYAICFKGRRSGEKKMVWALGIVEVVNTIGI